MVAANWIQRRRAEVAVQASSTAPIYHITEPGLSQLALGRDDMRYLSHKPPCTRTWQNFRHYSDVSEDMIRIFAALKVQTRCVLGAHYFEHTILNADSDEATKRYRLYTETQLQPKRIVCAPDAAFEMQVGPYRMAYYLEHENGTDSPMRVAAKKAAGFSGLFDTKKFKLHFPQAQDLRVLAVCPTAGWRDALRKAMKDKPGAGRWRFIALSDLTAETFFGPVFWRVEGGPHPLVSPEPSPTPVVVDGGGKRG